MNDVSKNLPQGSSCIRRPDDFFAPFEVVMEGRASDGSPFRRPLEDVERILILAIREFNRTNPYASTSLPLLLTSPMEQRRVL